MLLYIKWSNISGYFLIPILLNSSPRMLLLKLIFIGNCLLLNKHGREKPRVKAYSVMLVGQCLTFIPPFFTFYVEWGIFSFWTDQRFIFGGVKCILTLRYPRILRTLASYNYKNQL